MTIWKSMENRKPAVSIIMPTLNSEKTIGMSLESVKKQEFDQSLIEILVVDGGSADKTIEIAKGYGCRILENKRKQQEYAKYIGIIEANSKYAIFLDSDEVFGNNLAIRKRVSVLENTDSNILIMGGYKKPAGFSFINDYINIFSDPFANFIYGVSTDCRFFIESLSKKYKLVEETDSYAKFSYFEKQPPLIDMCAGNCMDLEYFKKHFSSYLSSFDFIPRIFYLLTAKDNNFCVLKNDFITHYSSDSIKKFIKKLRWRIVANIFYKDIPGTGFSNREEFSKKQHKYKKYLFIPYAILVIPVVIEAIYKSLKYRNGKLLIHIPLTLYTAILIFYYYALIIFDQRPALTIYGGSEKINGT